MLTSIIGLLMGGVAHVFSGESAQNIISKPAVNVSPYVVPDPLPAKLEFIAYLHPDLSAPRVINTPSGKRYNIQVLEGNWTLPNGELFATALPGIGAEYGWLGHDGRFRVEVSYTVQFAKDDSYGYVKWNGYGDLGVDDEGFVLIETDSADNLEFTKKVLYGQGTFIGKDLVVPHYSFPRP